MKNSMTAATSQQQQQQPQMQKKKKSKNKKGNKATPAEVGSTSEADSAKKPEFNANGLSEQLAHELHLSNTNNSSNHNSNNNRNINSTASSDKLRKSNKLANGTTKKELSAPHQVNGHDNTAAAALELPAETKHNGSSASAEKQHQQEQQQQQQQQHQPQQQQQSKKTKSKNNKQKHKESDKGNNCHKICVNQKQSTQDETVETITVHDQKHVDTLNNGFCTATDMDEVKESSSFKQNTNENINKVSQELLTNNKAAEAEQTQQHQQELKVATTPASTANSEEDSAAKQDGAEENVASPTLDLSNVLIEYKEYESELQMHDIMRLIQAELSEPYSIYTYRYFIYNWPKLCFLAAHGNEYVGAIVCKLDRHMNVKRGYIAMLAVRKEYRKLKIGTTLVQKAIEAMLADNADEVVLETEMRNLPALRLYENLGFVRDKRLFRYYLNGVDALRLKLWFR